MIDKTKGFDTKMSEIQGLKLIITRAIDSLHSLFMFIFLDYGNPSKMLSWDHFNRTSEL